GALVSIRSRVGLLRETYGLLRVEQTMDREQKLEGPRITEFDGLFHLACQASVEDVVLAATRAAGGLNGGDCVDLLGRLIEPYLRLWSEHNRTLRLRTLEVVSSDGAWAELSD